MRKIHKPERRLIGDSSPSLALIYEPLATLIDEAHAARGWSRGSAPLSVEDRARLNSALNQAKIQRVEDIGALALSDWTTLSRLAAVYEAFTARLRQGGGKGLSTVSLP